MGEINIPRSEQEAQRAIDTRELDRLIAKAIREETTGTLYPLPLASCGPYVSEQLRNFDRALVDYNKSKAPKKRATTESDARQAGWKLANAVQSMQNRMETEEKERDFFYVDDDIFCPRSFSRRLAVRVNYRWRLNAENGWSFGSITFIHDFELLPDDAAPIAKRKLSATKKEQELQETRYRAWDD